MGTTTAIKPTPSREQLQMAFRHYAGPHWPATLEEALARPAYRDVITMLARRMGRATWQAGSAPQHSLPRGYVPPTPTAPPAVAKAQPRTLNTAPRVPVGNLPQPMVFWPSAQKAATGPGWIDRKRAAGNDHGS